MQYTVVTWLQPFLILTIAYSPMTHRLGTVQISTFPAVDVVLDFWNLSSMHVRISAVSQVNLRQQSICLLAETILYKCPF